MLTCRFPRTHRRSESSKYATILKKSVTRRGAAAVEMAVVLPLLLSLAMMTFDLGSIVSTYLVLSNAGRTGADHAATHRVLPASRSLWESRIKDAIQSEMVSFKKFDPTQLQTTISTTANADQSTQVVVDLRYMHTTIVPWPGLPKKLSLHYRVEMRQYQ
ncbi:MAG: TadE-like protein [Schlesneria sp.]|nr:TadE-like protein [Schlesneria sp.]